MDTIIYNAGVAVGGVYCIAGFVAGVLVGVSSDNNGARVLHAGLLAFIVSLVVCLYFAAQVWSKYEFQDAAVFVLVAEVVASTVMFIPLSLAAQLGRWLVTELF